MITTTKNKPEDHKNGGVVNPRIEGLRVRPKLNIAYIYVLMNHTRTD